MDVPIVPASRAFQGPRRCDVKLAVTQHHGDARGP